MSQAFFPTPLVEASWLAQHLHLPSLVIVDCRFTLADPARGRQSYCQAHIPGAYYLDLNQDLSGPAQGRGGRHPLPSLANLIPKLEACGIGSQPPALVVAYDDTQSAFASRLWWLLNYLGHPTASVLQGGLTAWQQAGYPLTQAIPEHHSASQLVPRPQNHWLVQREAILPEYSHAPNRLLIDSRSPERFRGEHEPIDPVAGSIPGAVNAFWQTVFDESGHMLPAEQLRQHWQALENVEDTVVYCGSGVTACVNLLSQVAAGYPIQKLYVGGWSDWCFEHLDKNT